MSKQIIPLVLIAFDGAEAAICAYQRDWARSLYWASAAMITLSTVIME